MIYIGIDRSPIAWYFSDIMNMNASGVIVCSNIFTTLNTAAEHSMTWMPIGGIGTVEQWITHATHIV